MSHNLQQIFRVSKTSEEFIIFFTQYGNNQVYWLLYIGMCMNNIALVAIFYILGTFSAKKGPFWDLFPQKVPRSINKDPLAYPANKYMRIACQILGPTIKYRIWRTFNFHDFPRYFPFC